MNLAEELKRYEGKIISLIREPENKDLRCPVLDGKLYLHRNERSIYVDPKGEPLHMDLNTFDYLDQVWIDTIHKIEEAEPTDLEKKIIEAYHQKKDKVDITIGVSFNQIPDRKPRRKSIQ